MDDASVPSSLDVEEDDLWRQHKKTTPKSAAVLNAATAIVRAFVGFDVDFVFSVMTVLVVVELTKVYL